MSDLLDDVLRRIESQAVAEGNAKLAGLARDALELPSGPPPLSPAAQAFVDRNVDEEGNVRPLSASKAFALELADDWIREARTPRSRRLAIDWKRHILGMLADLDPTQGS